MNIVHNEIEIQKNTLVVKSGERIETQFKILLNKWNLNHIEGSLKTVNKDLFPVKMNTDVLRFNGETSFDLNLSFEGSLFALGGKLFDENVNLTEFKN